MGEAYHIPVLTNEVLHHMTVKAGGVYVDATFGGGGHSRMILNQLNENGRLFAFDVDTDATQNLIEDKRLTFIQQNFRHFGKYLRLQGIEKIDGLLADLGVSSWQIDGPDRGFSYQSDNALLDMRMNQNQAHSAADILANYTQEQLADLFYTNADMYNARKIAHAICTYRQHFRIQRVGQLKKAINTGLAPSRRQIAQVFQSLRIAVNDELGALHELLRQSKTYLKSGGVICVITFHSLEDRIVKRFFLSDPDIWQTNKNTPIYASTAERTRNPRSISAKLRYAIRK